MADFEMTSRTGPSPAPTSPKRAALQAALARSSALWLALTLAASASGAGEESSAAGRLTGQFSLLTYNVAGLPEPVSESHPALNTPVISSLLNLYDVAVVQEDFAYHGALASQAAHPFRSLALVPNEKVGIGDGLNEFSQLPFTHFERITWRACHGTLADGSDCFAPKGFTVATHTLATGVTLDLYDVHFDAGYSPGDILARAAQAEQLLAHLLRRSSGHAVVVAGDTNMDVEDEKVLVSFMKRGGLVDACRELHCDDRRRIDRVMYRGSRTLDLRAERLAVDARFVTPSGKDLSDHKALGVMLTWRRTPPHGAWAASR